MPRSMPPRRRSPNGQTRTSAPVTGSPNGTGPVPDRLRQLVVSWDERGRAPQPPIRWNAESWTAFLPTHASLFTGLPNPIDRRGVTAHTQTADRDEDAAVEAFITAMVWGYGRIGYGPFRTARVLTDNPAATATLRQVAVRVHRDGDPRPSVGWP